MSTNVATKVWSVHELTLAIKQHLESRFIHVVVQGEVSNCKEQSSGHCYFTLKDNAAQLSAVLFKGNARALSRPLKGGDQVIATGELSLYAPRGNYQLIVRELRFAGVGELLLKLHELKTKLQEKGWFEAERKKPLPKFPKVIGVVTSPTGAVIQDILNVLRRRFPGFQLLLSPVRVQGEGAAEEIALAIEQFNQYQLADVLIVGRGGGSIEDLWAFNEERVASAIHASRIPIISAIGHETDFTIADLVADMRAPTPSAAAEMVIAEKGHYLQGLAQAQRRVHHALGVQIHQRRLRLNGIALHPLFKDPYTFLGKYHQQLDTMRQDVGERIESLLALKKNSLLSGAKRAETLKPQAQLAALRHKLFSLYKGLVCAIAQQITLRKKLCDESFWRRQLQVRIEQKINQQKTQFQALVAHLQAIDPKNLLIKGYCILFAEKKDSVILSAKQVRPNQKICILVGDGEIGAIVNDTVPHL